MSKLKIILIVGILAIIALGVFVTRPNVTQAPSDVPAPIVDNRAKFNTPITMHVGESVEFTDGLSFRLGMITDSRCPADVQCIWQGELSPIFWTEEEPFYPHEDIFLSTVRDTSVTKYGYTFVLQSATEDTATIIVTYKKLEVIINPPTVGICFVGGCSSQICSDQKDIMSTCEWTETYACYKTAKCERQATGKCGWTETSSLKACLSGNNTNVGYVAGHVTIGPFCPVEIEGQPCQVPPEAYTSREVVVYQNNDTTVKQRAYLDTQGNYKISLLPGKYFIQIQPVGIGPGEKKPVTITTSQTMTVNFDIDTGIR